MSRRVAIVTGGTAGIGEMTSARLAEAGYHVILTSRTQEKGDQTVDRIKQSIKKPISIEARPLDLQNFDSIRAFASQFDRPDHQINVLVCNAGSNMAPQIDNVTLDGLWVNNYLGHFYLVQLLIPVLQRSSRLSGEASRVIALSSLMHRFSNLNSKSIETVGTKADTLSYSHSKLAMTMLAFEIHRRYANKSIQEGRIFGIAVNPGAVRSEIWRNVYPIIKPVYDLFMRVMYLDSRQGSETSVHAATMPAVSIAADKLLYFTPYSTSSWKWLNLALDTWLPPFLMHVTESRPCDQALDVDLAKSLWNVSEQQVHTVLTSRPSVSVSQTR